MHSFLTTLFTICFSFSFAALVDLTATNRRAKISGLPDWSKSGYEKGAKPLPDSSLISKVISPTQLVNVYNVVANDAVDDTEGIQQAIFDNPGSPNAFTLIQLPSGTLRLSHPIYLSSNYLILRGAGSDPGSGTVLEFRPDNNTIYDALTPSGSSWDQSGTSFSWSYNDTSGGTTKLVEGDASGGWLWPGRSIFRVGSRSIASKYTIPAQLAATQAPNRVDLFYGSVNFHWRNDTKNKGYMAAQTMEWPGRAGDNKIYVDRQFSSWPLTTGTDVWIAAPALSQYFDSWQVQDPSYYQNSYITQDWFTITGSGTDGAGTFITLDHPLEWDVPANSVVNGATQMEGETIYTKVMPIDDPVHHVGIEDVYMTQIMPSLTPAQAVNEYGNLAPAYAMNGVVFRYARDSWIRNLRTFMTGSHPVATEVARHIQVQDSSFDGAWNKESASSGAGGNGYLRASRVWDSLFYNNTLRNLRHFSLQWSSMRNVAIFQNMTNDMNLHGGWEGKNLAELNYISVPYAHRAGSCTVNCGGEGGGSESGTWAPIYWSAGPKASKWAGASGPQNVFYRNYMLKAFTAGSAQEEYTPYFAKDGSLSQKIWQFGWDRYSQAGSYYQHLSNNGNNNILDWQGHERDRFMDAPNVGVNGQLTDQFTSLFLKDVTGMGGITEFSSIAGTPFCTPPENPKIVGYYFGSAESNACLPRPPSYIDTSIYNHVVYAYASLAANGTLTLTPAQQQQVQAIVAMKSSKPSLKVFIGVGGWGLGNGAQNLLAVSTSSSARTRLGTTALALLNTLGADGIDLEWSPCIGTTCISASQFNTIVTTVKTGLGTKLISLSTPNEFWSLSGINAVAASLASSSEFISIITHQQPAPNVLQEPNDLALVQPTITKARSAGVPVNKMLMGVPFYSRPFGNSTLHNACLAPTDLGQDTYSFLVLHAMVMGWIESFISGFYIDPANLRAVVSLNDGSTIVTETGESVSRRALQAKNLCMGGLSAFSVDQDSVFLDLTHALVNPQ